MKNKNVPTDFVVRRSVRLKRSLNNVEIKQCQNKVSFSQYVLKRTFNPSIYGSNFDEQESLVNKGEVFHLSHKILMCNTESSNCLKNHYLFKKFYNQY